MTDILVRMPNWLGDVVMATSALEALHRTGKYALHLLIRPPWGELFQNDSRIAEVIPCFDRGPALFRTASELRRRNFPAAVDFTHSLRSRILLRLCGVHRILREPPPNVSLSTTAVGTHQVLRYLSVIRPLVDTLPPAPWPPHLFPPPAPLSTSQEILLFPAAAYGPAKMWSAERYRDLLHRLLDRNWPVRLVGTTPDLSFLTELGSSFPSSLVTRRSSVPISTDLSLSDLMRQIAACRAVISCDSGAAHLAAALGRPVVVLFFSTDPAATAPVGYAVRPIAAAVPCRPCFLRRCPIGYLCRDAVTAESVLANLDDLFDEPLLNFRKNT